MYIFAILYIYIYIYICVCMCIGTFLYTATRPARSKELAELSTEHSPARVDSALYIVLKDPSRLSSEALVAAEPLCIILHYMIVYSSIAQYTIVYYIIFYCTHAHTEHKLKDMQQFPIYPVLEIK